MGIKVSPLEEFQNCFSREQKATIISTLIIISIADGNNSTFEKKRHINHTAVLLGISVSDSIVNTTLLYKLPKRIEVLNTLQNHTKEWSALRIDYLLKLAPSLSKTKLQYVKGILRDIGISENKFKEIINKWDEKLYRIITGYNNKRAL